MDHNLLRHLLGQSVMLRLGLFVVLCVLPAAVVGGCAAPCHERGAPVESVAVVGAGLYQEPRVATEVYQERILTARRLWIGAGSGQERQAIMEMLRRGLIHDGMSVPDLRRVFGPFFLDAGGGDVSGLILLTTTDTYDEWAKFDFREEAPAPDGLILDSVSLLYQLKPPAPSISTSGSSVRRSGRL